MQCRNYILYWWTSEQKQKDKLNIRAKGDTVVLLGKLLLLYCAILCDPDLGCWLCGVCLRVLPTSPRRCWLFGFGKLPLVYRKWKQKWNNMALDWVIRGLHGLGWQKGLFPTCIYQQSTNQ